MRYTGWLNVRKVKAIQTRVSIIVPTYEEEAYIENTLSSLERAVNSAEHRHVESEVIVVDAGTDNTYEKAKRFTENVYKTDHDGVSRARNLGASKANGNILVFVDADTIVPLNILSELEKTFAHKDVVASVGYVLPDGNNDLSVSERLFFKLDSFFIRRIVKFSKIFLKFYTRGDMLAVREKTFREVGGFDLKLNCMEITELLARLSKRGKIEVLDVPIYESGRRIRRYGLARNYMIWGRNFVSFNLLKKPFSSTWEPVR